MTIQFSGRLEGFVPGNFGDKNNAEGRKAYDGMKTFLNTFDIRNMMNDLPDEVALDVSVNMNSQKVTLSPQINGFWNVELTGCKNPQTLSFTQLDPASEQNKYYPELQKVFVKLQTELYKLLNIRQTTKAYSKQMNELGAFFGAGIDPEFLACAGSYGKKKMTPRLLNALQTMTQFFNDPEIKAAFAKNKDYKTYGVEHLRQKVTLQNHMAQNGLNTDVDASTQASEAYQTKLHELYENHEEEPAVGMTFRFRFRNMNFDFPPQYIPYGDLPKDAEVMKYHTVSFTFQELKENPQAVKQRLLEAQNFWNNKIEEYVGTEA